MWRKLSVEIYLLRVEMNTTLRRPSYKNIQNSELDHLVSENLQTAREYTKTKVKQKISKFMNLTKNNEHSTKTAKSGRYERMGNELRRHLDTYIC